MVLKDNNPCKNINLAALSKSCQGEINQQWLAINVHYTPPKETREMERSNLVLNIYVLPLKLCSCHISFLPLLLSDVPPFLIPGHV